MNNWYIINDLNDFTNKIRYIVYNNFGNQETETNNKNIFSEKISSVEEDELNNILSFKESLLIVKSLIKKQKNKKTLKTRLILNEENFENIVKDLNIRMVSNILNSLVKKGLMESGFDNEVNDFVFWVKEDEKSPPKTN
jgi:hypothetical protein